MDTNGLIVIMMDDIDDDDDSDNVDYDDDADERCFSISHLERDLSQKRVLMDDIKLKLTAAQENAETDADIMVVPLCLNTCLIG